MKKLLLCVLACFGLLQGQIIEVGTGNSYKPFAYVSEKGEAVGFDIELLKLLASYDTSLEFKFHPLPFTALFVGLDRGDFAMLAHQIAKTKEREERYIFSDTPYFNVLLNFIVSENSQISSFEDLKGKKIGALSGLIKPCVSKNGRLKTRILRSKSFILKTMALSF